MKVTKYPQSCLIIEKDGKRLLIDPGSFVSKKYKFDDLLPIDGILITHEHQDHTDPRLIKDLLSKKVVPVVGNQSTAGLFAGLISDVVADGQEKTIAGFQITARELPHVAMVSGEPGPQNTGYVIDGVFFHPGDGIEISNLKVKNTAVPIAGPDISPRDIYSFLKQVGSEVVIPIHYDYFPAEPHFFENLFSGMFKLPIKFITLESGQSAEI